MAENSKIGWTDHSHNFWWGCNKVSPECEHCYIGGIMKRSGHEPFNGPMRTVNWSAPTKWNRRARKEGRRYRIFTCSMSDFFHSGANAWREEAWRLIRQCDHLDWLILTKRINRVPSCLPDDWDGGYPNVWLGVTCGCRKSLWRLDALKDIPAATRFVSAEPLLEELDFQPYLGWLDWVITGCERAAKGKRRRMDLNWVANIHAQCEAAGVPHFFKQAYLEEKGVPCESPLLNGNVIQQFPDCESRSRQNRLACSSDSLVCP